MAKICRLYTESGGVNIDLVGGVFQLDYPVPAPPEWMPGADGLVQQTYPLTALVADDVPAATETLANALEGARLYAGDPHRYDPLWFEYYNDEKEGATRRLVLDGVLQRVSVWGHEALLAEATARANLLLICRPEAEASETVDVGAVVGGGMRLLSGVGPPTYSAGSGGATLDGVGGTLSISGNGSRPGRIGKLTVTRNTGTIGRLYAGIKPARGYDDSAFDPVWDAYAGTAVAVTTQETSPLTDYVGSGYMLTTPVLADTLLHSWTLRLDDIAATDHRAFYGSYYAIGRIYVPLGSNEYGVQIRHGIETTTGTPQLTINEEVIVDDGGGSWILVNMGRITIPGAGGRSAGNDLANFAIRVYVEQIGGTGGYVAWDSFILIPAEHYLSFDTQMELANAGDHWYAYTHPDGAVEIVQRDSAGTIEDVAHPDTVDWRCPHTGGTLVIVACRQAGSSQTSMNVDVSLEISERHMGWRDA